MLRFLLKLLLGGLALGLLLAMNDISSGMTGVEKVIVDISVGIIIGTAFLLFIIFSAASKRP